jgi:WD40 repeat protein
MSNSLTQHVQTKDTNDFIIAVEFIGDTPFFALADGSVLINNTKHQLHNGGILVATSNGKTLYTGGDDGKIIATAIDGSYTTIAHEKNRWIDAITCTKDTLAWSFAKTIRTLDNKGEIKTLDVESSCQGLCFRPKGYMVAIAQNGGAKLWMPNTTAAPDTLEWKGSHIDITWSPDSRFVVTSMQENQLHGWRLPEKAHMRMSGYPAKPRSFSWSMDGNWLATSGAEAAIIWPFASKEGPTGKAPRECGVRPKRVTKVSFHPKALVLALGYEDGFIMLIRLTDASELVVRTTTNGKPVTALSWRSDGQQLAFGTEDGVAGVLSLPL